MGDDIGRGGEGGEGRGAGLEERLRRLEQETGRLADIEAIRTLRHRYHECINERRFEEVPALFTGDATLDFGFLGRAAGREKITRFFAATPKLLEFVKQFIHNHVVEVDGDRGRGFSYMEAKTISGGVPYLVAGRYDDRYARVDGAWRFARMDFEPFFSVPFASREGWAAPEANQMYRREK